MRTNEERIAATYKRARELEKERNSRQMIIVGGTGYVLSLSVVIVLAFLMPGMMVRILPVRETEGFSASIFAGSSIIGFLVISVVAFLLGVAVTVFSFRLRKWQEEKNRENFP